MPGVVTRKRTEPPVDRQAVPGALAFIVCGLFACPFADEYDGGMTTPAIKVQPGYELVQSDDGSYATIKRPKDDALRHTIAFRVSSSELADIQTLIETFPQRELGVAMRWLLSDANSRGAIAERVRATTRPAP